MSTAEIVFGIVVGLATSVLASFASDWWWDRKQEQRARRRREL